MTTVPTTMTPSMARAHFLCAAAARASFSAVVSELFIVETVRGLRFCAGSGRGIVPRRWV